MLGRTRTPTKIASDERNFGGSRPRVICRTVPCARVPQIITIGSRAVYLTGIVRASARNGFAGLGLSCFFRGVHHCLLHAVGPGPVQADFVAIGIVQVSVTP